MYDLVTDISQTRYTVSNLVFDKNQVIIKEYPTGHMAYIGETIIELSKDIKEFITQ